MAIAIDRRMPPFGRILFAILITIALTAVSYALDGGGSSATGNAGIILSTKLAGTVTVDTEADATTGQLKAHATIINDGGEPSMGVVRGIRHVRNRLPPHRKRRRCRHIRLLPGLLRQGCRQGRCREL